jgi:hypothetical protein
MLVISFATNSVAQSTPDERRSAEFHAVTTAAATERPTIDLARAVETATETTTPNSQEPNPRPEHTGFRTCQALNARSHEIAARRENVHLPTSNEQSLGDG